MSKVQTLQTACTMEFDKGGGYAWILRWTRFGNGQISMQTVTHSSIFHIFIRRRYTGFPGS